MSELEQLREQQRLDEIEQEDNVQIDAIITCGGCGFVMDYNGPISGSNLDGLYTYKCRQSECGGFAHLVVDEGEVQEVRDQFKSGHQLVDYEKLKRKDVGDSVEYVYPEVSGYYE